MPYRPGKWCTPSPKVVPKGVYWVEWNDGTVVECSHPGHTPHGWRMACEKATESCGFVRWVYVVPEAVIPPPPWVEEGTPAGFIEGLFKRAAAVECPECKARPDECCYKRVNYTDHQNRPPHKSRLCAGSFDQLTALLGGIK